MRLSILLLLLAAGGGTVTAGEPRLESPVELKLLEIRLASYLTAYETTMARQSDVELQIVQTMDEATIDKLNKLSIRLAAHLEKLEVQVRATTEQIDELTPKADRQRALVVDERDQAAMPPDVRAEALLQTITRSIDFPGRSIRDTERQLDVAIDGPGFLSVVDSDRKEIVYTRLGKLDIDATGHLVVGSSNTGLPLAPTIRVPADAIHISISGGGEVSCRIAGEVQSKHLGQIRVALFGDPLGLSQIRENLFAESEASGRAQLVLPGEHDSGRLLQGCLELSDSDRIRELIDVLVDYLKHVRPAIDRVVEP